MYHIKFIEATRPRYMITRPVLHKAEAKTYMRPRGHKIGLEAVLALRT